MKVTIGSDHHGREVREKIIAMLRAEGHEVTDAGSHEGESVDYPDIAAEVAGNVGNETADRGVLICGSGIGMAIAANKFDGVRAAPCFNEEAAEMTRKHNNANVLCMSDATVSQEDNLKIVKRFMTTEFEGGRHQRRVDKIAELEKRN